MPSPSASMLGFATAEGAGAAGAAGGGRRGRGGTMSVAYASVNNARTVGAPAPVVSPNTDAGSSRRPGSA